MAEWLRLWTATSIRSPAVDSKTISVGNILGKDRKLTHAEIQAPHFKQKKSLSRKDLVQKSAKKQQTNVSILSFQDVVQTW